MLTKRQRQILDYIEKFIEKKGYSPSFEKVAKHFKLVKSTIHQHIETLKNKGYLKNQPRIIEISKNKKSQELIQIQILGTIAAGQPIEGIENKEFIKVAKSRLSSSGEHYALKVQGDSMIDEGIHDSDIVIIKKQFDAENGETIVALINDNEVTLKKIYKEKNGFRLQPANPKLKPIFIKELIIQGKVVSVIKNYKELKEKIDAEKKKISTGEQKEKIDLPKNTEPFIIIEDIKESLQSFPDESINCIITSPPYWNLRDYGTDNQIGNEKTPEKYIYNMLNIASQLRRILTKDGVFFLNIGDTYIKKNLCMIPEKLAILMQNNGWMLRNKIIWHKPNHMPSSIKNRFTNAWEYIFFFIRNDAKRKYYFDLDNIRIPHKTNGNNSKKHNLPKYVDEKTYKKYYSHLTPKKRKGYNGKFKNQKKNLGASPGARQSVNSIFYSRQRKYEVDSFEVCSYLKNWKKKTGIATKKVDKHFGYKDTAGHWFRTDESGRSLPSPNDWVKLKKLLSFNDKYDKVMTTIHYVLQTVDYHPKGKNPGDIWSINTDKLKEAHFAIFPAELPRKIIKACCPETGIVLDPFAGSGTTGMVAKELNRRSIMIDVNPKYKEIMKKRFKGINLKLF